MNPKLCKACGAPAVLPPSTLDLQANVWCEACGANHGSWRSVETPLSDNPLLRARPSSDLRTSQRVRSFLKATVVFNNRSSTLDCTLRDSSESGAKLLFAAHVPIPDEFDLEIPLKARKHRARVMWRTQDSCGVRFLEA
jgi:PilZ domain